MLSNFKQLVKDNQNDIIMIIGVVLISLLSFATGYIVAKQQNKKPIQIEYYEQYDSISHRSISRR